MASRSLFLSAFDFGSPQDWQAKSRPLRKAVVLGKLVSIFLFSGRWILAWFLLLVCLAIQFGGVYGFRIETDISKAVFDSIQYKDFPSFVRYALEFLLVGSLAYSLSYLGVYVQNVFEMLWRNTVTVALTGNWLSGKRFYFIERSELVENVDQRLAEDVRNVVNGVFGIFTGCLRVTFTIILYTSLLITKSTPVTYHVFGHDITTRADLLLGAYLSSIIGTGIIFRIGRKLIRLNMRQQHYEADLRFSLVSIRRHAEQVALMVMERVEHLRIASAFSALVNNYFVQQRMGLIISFASQIISHVQRLLPLALAVPRYMSGRMTYGDIIQTQSVFVTLSSSLTWFMQMYPMYAETSASFDRLFVLVDAIQTPEKAEISLLRDAQDDIVARDLVLRVPEQAEPVLEVQEWTVRAGEKWVITGPSGSGKSTLLRAMAGLCSEGEGQISLPRERRIMFLPQRPYLPHGTLLDLMLPDQPHSPENRVLCATLLRRFLLPRFVDQLDVGGDWSQRLSPGEQQRFALARAFVSSPDVLVLDEATSGLDQETAAAIYRILLDHPALTLISVVHARDLMMLHSKRLHIAGGVGRVMDNQEPPSGALLSLHRTS